MNPEVFQTPRRQVPWHEDWYFQKVEVISQITYVFCHKFLDTPESEELAKQMEETARNSKQDIMEVAASDESLKVIHVDRIKASRTALLKLREEYSNYLTSHDLPVWDTTHPRNQLMQEFCRSHNRVEHYMPYFATWSDEEMANIAMTLCFQSDAMLNKIMLRIEKEFGNPNDLTGQLYTPRTNYRKSQNPEIAQLRQELAELRAEVANIKSRLDKNWTIA